MSFVRQFARLFVPAAAVALAVAAAPAAAQPAAPLTLQVYNGDADSFHFGIDTLKAFFPEAKVVAIAPTVKKIEATRAKKLAVWGSKMGANAPKQVSLPEVLQGQTIQVEGQTLEIRGLGEVLPDRSFVWIPSIKTVAGGVNVYAGLHAWMADAPSAKERAGWAMKLDEMAALQPQRVIPGHTLPGLPQDASQIAYTRAYLQRFEAEPAKAPNGAALIEAMKAAYPDAGLGVALEIGAKVSKGEMKW